MNATKPQETKKAEKARERDEAIAKLRGMLKPGDTVQTILRHCARSGMMRCVSPIIDGEDVSWLVARVLGDRVHQTHGGIIVGGCGFDAGHSVVYDLASALWPEGFGCIGDADRSSRCPSNDHSNGDRSYVKHGEGNMTPDHWHKSGGYALRQQWL